VTVRDAQVEQGLDRTTSDERLAAFAGQVTHDLKTPLTTMSLSLELIRDELEDGTPAEDLLPLITRALRGAARMSSMIEDVLVFARIGTTVDPVPVDLDTLAAEAVADLVDVLADVDLEIGDLPLVQGDQALLRILLLHLIGNAAKFRSPERPPVVRVAASRLDQGWRLEVLDNGVGVPEAQREHVFEPMVRLDKSVEGTGIGLATCRRVAEAHGGAIGVTDGPHGVGSVFWVELPATTQVVAGT
jgi:signal transduction histidine kinase